MYSCTTSRRAWLRTISSALLFALFSFPAVSQQTAPAPAAATSPTAVIDWPVTFTQNITAGINAVGTKVQAKLLIATLAGDKVVPEGAIFSGEIIESQAKSSTEPSRLAIRMDTIQWKDAGLFPVKLYLTHWYHPFKSTLNQQGPATEYPQGKIGLRAPSPDQRPGVILNNPESGVGSLVSPQPRPIAKVEAVSGNDGAIVLTSLKSNIKLDKAITYVLADKDLGPQ
jgi:hypothetical protein